MVLLVGMQDPEQSARYSDKLTRELGPAVMSWLEDSATEDIVLNPDSSLWAKRTRGGRTPCVSKTRRTAGSAPAT